MNTAILLRGVLVVLVVLLTSACANASTSPPSSAKAYKQAERSAGGEQSGVTASEQQNKGGSGRNYAPPVEVLVTRDDSSLPLGCRPWEAAGLVTNFLEAFDRGDQEKLSRLFAPVGPEEPQPPGLYLTYDGKGDAFKTDNVEDLLGYFARRHKKGERLSLIEIDVGESWRPNSVDIGFVVRRDTQGAESPAGSKNIAIGKGGIDCRKQTIYLWNMAMGEAAKRSTEYNVEGEVSIKPCPEPPGWRPGVAVVACAR